MPYYPERRPDLSGEAQRIAAEKKKRQRLLRLCAVGFCSLLILYGAVRLILYLTELNDSRNTAAELRRIQAQEEVTPVVSASPAPQITRADLPEPSAPAAVTAAPEAPPEAPPTTLKAMKYPGNPEAWITDRFLKLRRKGQYIIGWLTLDGVDEAVCQRDNTYFLDHDATGKKNSNGAIFLDSGVSLLTRPYTLYLYGHNMKSGNMFGQLKKYKESAYFHKNRIITFDSMYENGQYAVFSVMEMRTVPGTARWYDLWSLDSKGIAEREKAIRTLEQRSEISSALDVQADDQLLLLITCIGDEDERLVVAARRLRDGEQADELQMKKSDGRF